MLAPTSRRVEMNTKPEINEWIHRQEERNKTYFRHHRDRIPERLAELDREWDVERAVETQFSVLSLLGAGLAALTNNRRWLILNGVTGWFMLQHATQGWCPPVPLFRRLGVRTAREIEEERCALNEELHSSEGE